VEGVSGLVMHRVILTEDEYDELIAEIERLRTHCAALEDDNRRMSETLKIIALAIYPPKLDMLIRDLKADGDK
jgi:hypothetical protein